MVRDGGWSSKGRDEREFCQMQMVPPVSEKKESKFTRSKIIVLVSGSITAADHLESFDCWARVAPLSGGSGRPPDLHDNAVRRSAFAIFLSLVAQDLLSLSRKLGSDR